MSATALLPVVQAPVAPPAPAAPSAPAAGNGNGANEGSDSFARMLDAAEARRQALAQGEAQPQAQPASGSNKPTAAPTSKKPEAGQATRAADRAAADGSAEADTIGAKAAQAVDAVLIDGNETADLLHTPLAPGADAAALLAGLAALPRPTAVQASARSTAAAGDGLRAAIVATDATDATDATEVGRPGTAPGSSLDTTNKTTGVLRGGTITGAGGGNRASNDGEFAPLMRQALAGADAAQHATEVAAQQPGEGARPAAETRATVADIGAAPAALLATAVTPGSAGALAGATPSLPAHAHLGATPGSPAFATQLGAQLTTFVREGVQHARLELHPLELGPVTVQIALDGSLARVNMAAENAATRQALEQAMPALASSLREAGLTLSGGGVFEQTGQPQNGSGAAGSGGGNGGERGTAGSAPGASNEAGPGPRLPEAARRRGVVDLVA